MNDVDMKNEIQEMRKRKFIVKCKKTAIQNK